MTLFSIMVCLVRNSFLKPASGLNLMSWRILFLRILKSNWNFFYIKNVKNLIKMFDSNISEYYCLKLWLYHGSCSIPQSLWGKSWYQTEYNNTNLFKNQQRACHLYVYSSFVDNWLTKRSSTKSYGCFHYLKKMKVDINYTNV